MMMSRLLGYASSALSPHSIAFAVSPIARYCCESCHSPYAVAALLSAYFVRNSWYDAMRFCASDSAAIAARSLSSGVPAGMTIGVFWAAIMTASINSSETRESWRRVARISHLVEMSGRRSESGDVRNFYSHGILTRLPTGCYDLSHKVGQLAAGKLLSSFSLLCHHQPSRCGE